MRKYFVLIVIGIVAAFGINTATASAGNCSPIQVPNGIQKNGSGPSAQIFYKTYFNCTGVEAVQIAYLPAGASTTTGFYDAAAGAYANGKVGGNCSGGSCTGGGYTGWTSTESHPGVTGFFQYSTNNVWAPIWWYGGYTRNIAPFLWFRIKHTANHTYGSWYTYFGNYTAVNN